MESIIKQHGEGINVLGRFEEREGNQNKRGKSVGDDEGSTFTALILLSYSIC